MAAWVTRRGEVKVWYASSTPLQPVASRSYRTLPGQRPLNSMTKDHFVSCSLSACERAFILLGLGKRALQIVAGARSLLHQRSKTR